MNRSAQSTTETARVQGDALVEEVRALLHEGNVRRITIRNGEGHAVIEIPVTAGVVAAVAAPVLIGVAAIAALANNWRIDIDRTSLERAAATASQASAT
jgi:hypothetical protein